MLILVIIVVMVVMMFVFILVLIIVMMVMMFMFILIFIVIIFKLTEIFGETVGRADHRVVYGFAAQLIPRCGDDAGIRIEFTDDIHIRLECFFICHLCSGENDTGGGCDLIIKEFTEVLVIDLASLRVNDSAVAVEFQSFHGLDDFQNVGEFADTGRFNHDMVGIEFLHNFFQRLLEVTLQGAADAAAVDFGDLNACFFEEAAVDTDFAEFIFNQDNLLSCKYVFDQFLNQSCFTGSEKAGNHIDLSHRIHLLSRYLLYTTRQ